jgi:diguanylate cyclase (GGDEF)-like protein/PAS domain S-box-containing protein
MYKNDRYYIYLSIATIAFMSGLFWLFYGVNIITLFVGKYEIEVVFAFVSGFMLMVVCVGIYILVRIILNYTGWVPDDETTQLTIYQSILEEESEGIFFKDRNGYYRLMNPAAKQLLNLENKQVIGRKDYQIFDAILAHKIENEDRKILQNNETVIWETQRSTGNGSDIWLCKKIPCRNNKGQVIGIVGYCRNITVLKAFQNLNVDLEHRYQKLFDKLPYPVLVMDAINLKPYSFNQAMTNLLGYNTHEFTTLRFNVHLSEEHNESFLNTASSLIETGGGEFEARLNTRDKDKVDVAGYAQTLQIDDRQYLHMLLHDVTELRRSTEELIGSEVKYRSLFEHASDAILIIDIKTLRIIDANDVALTSLGYRRDDLMQLTLLELEAGGDQRDTSEQLSNLEIYNHVNYEHIIRDRKGRALQVEINAHKVNYGVHQVYQFVIRDISLRKKTELALKNSEQRYRQMFENNQAIKLVIDFESYKIEAANLAAAEFYGYEQSAMPGMSLEKINILSKEKIIALRRLTTKQNLGYYTCPHRMASGDVRFVEVRDGEMEIDGQRLLYSIIHDVTETRRAEDQLLLASKMFDCTTDAVIITDRHNQVISINQAFTELTGFELSEIINTNADNMLVGRDQKFITADVVAAIHKRGLWQGEIWQRMKNGDTCNLHATINVVMNEQGEIINRIIMMSATGLMAAMEAVAGHFTRLTELPNRTLFESQLKQAIDRSQRSNKQVAVLLLDIRNFSDINRAYSRESGDQILKIMARRLKHNVRESDTVSHFEKDDFAVLLEDLADVQQTGIVAQKILSTLKEEYQVDNAVIQLDISIGISISPEDGLDELDLLEKAGYALRESRLIPGSSFRLYSQHMNDSAWQWLQTDRDLHSALKNNEFVLVYLPQIELSQQRVEAVEALVRWQTPQGLLEPRRFLPNAEQSGFISAIGSQVISMACADFGKWQKQGIELDYIILNLSFSQVVDDFENFILDQCSVNGLQPDRIMLDFNEQKFIVSSTEQRDILRSLQNKGFKICIDDFGSGSASLSCLLQCPVDAIKIDPAYTSTGIDNINTRRLLMGVIAMAKKLDMLVVAEGVESIESYQNMLELGCTHMQGHYFSKTLQYAQLQNYVKNFSLTRREQQNEKT